MQKLSIAIIAGVMLAHTSFAQQAATSNKDRKMSHQVGVQMNELIKQVFNFGSTAPAITNPYLLTYSINSKKSGWGLRLGLGYNYQSFTNDDGITNKETQINDINARLGIERAFNLSSKWSAGAGLDGVISENNDYTKSTVRSFDTTSTSTKSHVTKYGGGAMCWLRYHITDKVLVGTEASFYYKMGKEKQDVEITKRDNTQPSKPYKTTSTSTDNKNSEGLFSLPVVFYLIVKF